MIRFPRSTYVNLISDFHTILPNNRKLPTFFQTIQNIISVMSHACLLQTISVNLGPRFLSCHISLLPRQLHAHSVPDFRPLTSQMEGGKGTSFPSPPIFLISPSRISPEKFQTSNGDQASEIPEVFPPPEHKTMHTEVDTHSPLEPFTAIKQ